MDDFDYSECFSGCYNLVGFTTHIGNHPQQAKFATVIQMERDVWYYCTNEGICVLKLEDVLSDFNGLADT